MTAVIRVMGFVMQSLLNYGIPGMPCMCICICIPVMQLAELGTSKHTFSLSCLFVCFHLRWTFSLGGDMYNSTPCTPNQRFVLGGIPREWGKEGSSIMRHGEMGSGGIELGFRGARAGGVGEDWRLYG